jgi:Domain of unknown function (DUF4389)
MADPVRLVVTDDLRRSRLTVFFRLLLALPHLVWIALWASAVAFAVTAMWVAALATGRPPAGLHRFVSRFIRYTVHVAAYVSLAANPFPGFTGEPGYPVDVELPEPGPQARWKTALRLLLALPALVVVGAIGSGPIGGGGSLVAVCAFLGWFVALALARMPNGLRDLAGYGIGYTAQTYAYLLLVTDRYPNADPEAAGPRWSLPPHPVTVQVDDDGKRSRLTVFFRLLLALPHFFWLTLWGIVAILAALANGIYALVRGRSAAPLHRFLAAYVRYSAHVTAFVALVANPFPGFTGEPGYPLDVSIGEAERQSRWVTLFRTFLVLPALVVAGGLTSALVAVAFLGWLVSLATGRMPEGLRNLGAIAVRYLAQTNAYWLIVTDDYPYASPALRARRPEEPAAELYGEAAA